MVDGKLLGRARYPGTGTVSVLLVGRLIRRERSAARTTTNTTSSAETVRREIAANFFRSFSTRESLGRFVPSAVRFEQPAKLTSFYYRFFPTQSSIRTSALFRFSSEFATLKRR